MATGRIDMFEGMTRQDGLALSYCGRLIAQSIGWMSDRKLEFIHAETVARVGKIRVRN